MFYFIYFILFILIIYFIHLGGINEDYNIVVVFVTHYKNCSDQNGVECNICKKRMKSNKCII